MNDKAPADRLDFALAQSLAALRDIERALEAAQDGPLASRAAAAASVETRIASFEALLRDAAEAPVASLGGALLKTALVIGDLAVVRGGLSDDKLSPEAAQATLATQRIMQNMETLQAFLEQAAGASEEVTAAREVAAAYVSAKLGPLVARRARRG